MDKSLQAVARYAASISYQDLPKVTIRTVKQRIIDSLGCALGAYLLEAGKCARKLCAPTDAPFSARVIGSLVRTTPEMAAFANATMVRDLDHSDVYHPSINSGGHPSNCISAPLAMAEAVCASGKSLITAVALGYEMYVPFIEGRATPKSEFEKDGITATFGGAMAAGKLLGLNEERLAVCASLALVPNIGLGMRRVGKVSMYKEVYAGMAARQAIFAALMAQSGMSAPEEAIESPIAGLKKVAMEGGAFNVDLMAKKGQQFMIDRTVIKAFPIGGGVHHAAWAAVELRKKVRADEVASILVKTENYGMSTSAKPEHWAPKTRETADHSIPIAVSMILVDGYITAESWKKERFKAPEVLDLVNRIKVVEEPEFTRQYPATKNMIIEATTHSGEKRTVHKILSPDEEKTTDEMIEAKFLRYADNVLTPHQARATLDAVWNLDKLDNAGRILDNLQV